MQSMAAHRSGANDCRSRPPDSTGESAVRLFAAESALQRKHVVHVLFGFRKLAFLAHRFEPLEVTGGSKPWITSGFFQQVMQEEHTATHVRRRRFRVKRRGSCQV